MINLSPSLPLLLFCLPEKYGWVKEFTGWFINSTIELLLLLHVLLSLIELEQSKRVCYYFYTGIAIVTAYHTALLVYLRWLPVLL